MTVTALALATISSRSRHPAAINEIAIGIRALQEAVTTLGLPYYTIKGHVRERGFLSILSSQELLFHMQECIERYGNPCLYSTYASESSYYQLYNGYRSCATNVADLGITRFILLRRIYAEMRHRVKTGIARWKILRFAKMHKISFFKSSPSRPTSIHREILHLLPPYIKALYKKVEINGYVYCRFKGGKVGWHDGKEAFACSATSLCYSSATSAALFRLCS